jgi:hypothetical protein
LAAVTKEEWMAATDPGRDSLTELFADLEQRKVRQAELLVAAAKQLVDTGTLSQLIAR